MCGCAEDGKGWDGVDCVDNDVDMHALAVGTFDPKPESRCFNALAETNEPDDSGGWNPSSATPACMDAAKHLENQCTPAIFAKNGDAPGSTTALHGGTPVAVLRL